MKAKITVKHEIEYKDRKCSEMCNYLHHEDNWCGLFQADLEYIMCNECCERCPACIEATNHIADTSGMVNLSTKEKE